MIGIRVSGAVDEALVARFLALAAHEEAVEVVFANPALATYAQGWGRKGDSALVAEDETTHKVVGMCWARFWTAEQHGFGWIDEWTPELAIAVEPQFQGQGIGARLIEALKVELLSVSMLDSQGASFRPERVALNVRADSPAVRLYERVGFVRVEGSERQNRTGSISYNMVAPL
ncbi:N-acetyltransferase [bacterium]|nr:MAG: N-acetyltransferase [bacterium]